MNRLVIPAIAIATFAIATVVMRVLGHLWAALEQDEISLDQ